MSLRVFRAAHVKRKLINPIVNYYLVYFFIIAEYKNVGVGTASVCTFDLVAPENICTVSKVIKFKKNPTDVAAAE